MSIPAGAVSRSGANANSNSPTKFWWRWLGPAGVLVIGIAFFAFSQIRQHSSAAFFPVCGLAASAPPDEVSFMSENDKAMTEMMSGMTIRPTGVVDRDFVEMMVSHHQGAIDMAQAELRHGHNAQLRRMAQEIIVTQQQEIAAMRLAVGEPLPTSAEAPDQIFRPTVLSPRRLEP